MQIRFPRRIQTGFRPWYGLTLRQMAYLAVAAIVAGAVVLFGPAAGSDLLVRVLIGLAIIGGGVALAFFRKDGLSIEQWVVTQIKFLLRPHKRVWTRTGDGSARDQAAEIQIEPADPTPAGGQARAGRARSERDERWNSPRLLQPDAPGPVSTPAVIVLIDLAMLLALLALGVYLAHGGLSEIQGWVAMQIGR